MEHDRALGAHSLLRRLSIYLGVDGSTRLRVEDRALHVVEDHADFVREIFRRYLEIGAVVPLKAGLDLGKMSGCRSAPTGPARRQAAG